MNSKSYFNEVIPFYLLSFYVILCFPWSIIPFPGLLLQPIFEAINWIWVPIFGSDCIEIYSDSLGMRLSFLHVFVFTTLFNLVLFKFFRKYVGQITFWTNTFLMYFLIFFLLKYGFDKVFKTQFPFPEANVLYTPIGLVSKGLLYWSSVGSSYSFNLISGGIECCVAILLLWNKTRFLGLLLAFFVVVNIVIINFSFDIDVKMLSGLMVLTCGWLLFPYKQRILNILNVNSTSVLLPVEASLQSFKPKQIQWKIIIVMLLFFDILHPYFNQNNFNADKAPKSDMVGAYRIIDSISNLSQIESPTHCFVNSRGYLIFQNADFEKVSLSVSIQAKSVVTKGKIQSFMVQKTNGNFQLVVFENNVTRTLKLKKLQINRLPLSNYKL